MLEKLSNRLDKTYLAGEDMILTCWLYHKSGFDRFRISNTHMKQCKICSKSFAVLSRKWVMLWYHGCWVTLWLLIVFTFRFHFNKKLNLIYLYNCCPYRCVAVLFSSLLPYHPSSLYFTVCWRKFSFVVNFAVFWVYLFDQIIVHVKKNVFCMSQCGLS